jgi:predicted Fe-Mo cluster-binding NifX family protein
MKICVSATANSLDAPVDPRFGRCQYFLIVDSETMQFEAIPNMASGAMGGAGIQAAQIIASKGVKALITGNVGPNAFQALSAAGIQIITGAYGTVREAVEKYKKGELKGISAPTVGGHFGMGAGRGRGWRRRQWEP